MKIGTTMQQVSVGEQLINQAQIQNWTIEGVRKQVLKESQQVQQEVQKDRDISSEELQKILEELKKKFDMLRKYLKIEIDAELEMPVIKIIERDTNRVIRQIPPDYLLELMKKIDQMLGILVEKEV
ncbi:MAG: flagellar protein FlaG [Archaeoglobaceae archaeon]